MKKQYKPIAAFFRHLVRGGTWGIGAAILYAVIAFFFATRPEQIGEYAVNTLFIVWGVRSGFGILYVFLITVYLAIRRDVSKQL